MTTKKISKIHQRVMTASSATRNINRMIEGTIHADDSGDEDFFAKDPSSWEELNELRQALAEGVLTFTMQVESMVNNPIVSEVLQDKKPEFDRLVQTFMSDTQEFSSKVAQLRAEHEHLSGKITNIDDFGKFNRIALRYENAKDELSVLLAPTISEMVLLINNQHNKREREQELTDPTVVSDVQVKS